MSSQKEDTPIPEESLPTPASTPAPYSFLDSEYKSDSATSSASIHTAIPYQPQSDPIHPSNMSSTNEEFGTPAQRQAAHVTSTLHKTPIKPSLSATNYVAWSDSVRFGLSAASYNVFLETDEIDDTGLVPSRHLATKKCIFHWLLANMETSQSTWFISMISSFEDGIRVTPFAPSLLWKTIRSYYVNNSESVKLMLRADITNFKQGHTRDLLEHIEAFRAKINAYL